MTRCLKAASLALAAFFFSVAAFAQGAAPSLTPSAPPSAEEEALWKRIARGGVVVMVRHAATEPGVGDPPHFRLGDCSTQRNLSEEGRIQARRLDAAFRARGIVPAQVLSSQWCRCRDTAQEAFGTYAEAPALNSFFDNRATEGAQSAQARALIAAVKPGEVRVLVTHQVNITALGGQGVGLGDLFVFGRDAKLLGRISAP